MGCWHGVLTFLNAPSIAMQRELEPHMIPWEYSTASLTTDGGMRLGLRRVSKRKNYNHNYQYNNALLEYVPDTSIQLRFVG